jgi:hypothetical protein
LDNKNASIFLIFYLTPKHLRRTKWLFVVLGRPPLMQ